MISFIFDQFSRLYLSSSPISCSLQAIFLLKYILKDENINKLCEQAIHFKFLFERFVNIDRDSLVIFVTVISITNIELKDQEI